MPRTYVIRQQDCLASVAAASGFLPETIWTDAANADLKSRRKNPHALLPGDELVIPDLRIRQEAGDTESRHRFRRKGVPEKLTIVLQDEAGATRADLPYTAVIDGAHHSGRTNGVGKLEIAIPPGARSGTLYLGEERAEAIALHLGGIDPIDTVSGAQQRLNNLGYRCDRSDGVLEVTTIDALREFQAANGVEVTGELDAATQAKLEEIHGC